ncbi:MAG: transposase [Nitrososphaerales archaeon]
MGYQSKWTQEQKIAIVMESLNTNISIAELCRKHNVTPNAFYGWKEKFLGAGKLALASSGSPKNNHMNVELAAENERLKKLIGELTIANDCLKKAMLEGGKRR